MERKPWSQQQDLALKLLVQQIGIQNWTIVAARLSQACIGSFRAGKQCRQRWINHLDLAISKKPWSRGQEKIIFQKHNIYGNKWKEIAKHLQSRTQNDIKNHFYATMRKGIRRLNKLLGFPKNPVQIRKIKPVVLSKVCEKQHQIQSQLVNKLDIQGVFVLILQLSKNEPSPEKCDGLLENQKLIKAAYQFLQKMLNQNRAYQQQKLVKKLQNIDIKDKPTNIQSIKGQDYQHQLDISEYLCLGQYINDIQQKRPRSQEAYKKAESTFSENGSIPTSSKDKSKNKYQKKNYKIF